ncbi:anaerobic selenocysteine-containing dehydrogenase [Rhodopseudomonas rhenobacensis]|uniref:Anaerobic selenocysteine-containing dehydrogenase n=1 Tax=Rhodopseudomonas rhenobacensis TaxID=87461 RepID=A0A7W7Z647_9BRAD|nr:molybdopterin-dependent oxidoreductase [Rhodopseudomonas rhenobacensis]MBB5048716.1 anaerobic selenocysteine-containing dehydrogenase [Rhodopseudomonas rhenobacensis]
MTSGIGGAALSGHSLLNGGVALVALGGFGPPLLVAAARATSGEGAPRMPSDRHGAAFDAVYAPTRIKHPMVRRAYLEQGAGAERGSRGKGDFVRVSWERALDLVAAELRRVAGVHGSAAVFSGADGGESRGQLHGRPRLLRRLMSLTGVAVAACDAPRAAPWDAAEAGEIKLAYWLGGLLPVAGADRNRLLRLWRSLETCIVQDSHWTPAARRADIVLPTTTSWERDDIECVDDEAGRSLRPIKRLIAPLFESRSDHAIFAALAERLGKGQAFTESRS